MRYWPYLLKKDLYGSEKRNSRAIVLLLKLKQKKSF